MTIVSPGYWNFSWHEIGIYDMPAIIDYILLKTGQEKLHYIGHSQGTTVNLVMLAKKVQYNQKLKTAILLSPVAYLKNSNSFIVKFGANPAVETTLRVCFYIYLYVGGSNINEFLCLKYLFYEWIVRYAKPPTK